VPSSYTNTNQPTMTPSTESAPATIGARSSARVPGLKAGLALELCRPEPVDELVLDELVPLPVVDVGVNVALGMSDDATADMGAGDWPPQGGLGNITCQLRSGDLL